MLPQAIKAYEQPGVPSKAGILAQADRMVRSEAHSWLSELIPELEEKTAVSTALPDCSTGSLLNTEVLRHAGYYWRSILFTGRRVWQLCRYQQSYRREDMGVSASLCPCWSMYSPSYPCPAFR